eukprot:11156526-Lingulodinium_polyedra.AAC.1
MLYRCPLLLAAWGCDKLFRWCFIAVALRHTRLLMLPHGCAQLVYTALDCVHGVALYRCWAVFGRPG